MDWQIDKPIPIPSHVYSNGLLAMKQSPDRAKSLLNVTHRKNHCPEPFPQPATLIPVDITIGTLNPRFPHAALPGMLTGVETARQRSGRCFGIPIVYCTALTDVNGQSGPDARELWLRSE
jgi:hypothetical protein